MKTVVHIDPSEVIALNQDRFGAGNLFVSPANTPEYVESDYDKQRSEFALDFVYQGTEPVVEKSAPSGTYIVGSNSGRLYGIRIKTNPHDSQQLLRDLKKILTAISEGTSSEGRARWGQGSFAAVSSILTHRRDDILKPRFG